MCATWFLVFACSLLIACFYSEWIPALDVWTGLLSCQSSSLGFVVAATWSTVAVVVLLSSNIVVAVVAPIAVCRALSGTCVGLPAAAQQVKLCLASSQE